MATRRTTFKQWYAELDRPVPLNMVSDVLNISREQVRLAVRQGKLRIFTFRAENGKVFRMVPHLDLRVYKRNPLTQKQLSVAFRKLLAA